MEDPFVQLDPVVDLKAYQVSLFLSPKAWGNYRLSVKLDWHFVRFEKGFVDKVPKDKIGIYTFVVMPGIADHPLCAYLMYVGKVEKQTFRKRFEQYVQEQNAPLSKARRVHISTMLQRWKDHLWFCYAPLDDQSAIGKVEDSLIAAYLPKYNHDYPASIRKELAVALS